MDILKSKREQYTEQLEKKMLRFQHYLEQTVEVADDYHEVSDLLARHATLEATNEDLRTQQEDLAEEFEGTRLELQAYVKQKANEILNLNNQISSMRKELEVAQRETLDLELKKDYSMNVLSQKTLEYGQVSMSTDNLFQRCLEKSHIRYQPETNTLSQLDIIGNFCGDLRYVLSLKP